MFITDPDQMQVKQFQHFLMSLQLSLSTEIEEEKKNNFTCRWSFFLFLFGLFDLVTFIHTMFWDSTAQVKICEF